MRFWTPWRDDVYTGRTKPGYDGSWAWDPSALAGWRWALFSPVRARYMRLTATASTGGTVKINEVDVGGSTLTPTLN